MKGIFVNEDGCVRYAEAIVSGIKLAETRNKRMLSACVGDRVAIVRTRRGKAPHVVGYATVYRETWYDQKTANSDLLRKFTLVPHGSKYEAGTNGKWFYWLTGAVKCEPFPLPASAIRHGRSWCEF